MIYRSKGCRWRFVLPALLLLGACSRHRTDVHIPVDLVPPRESPPPAPSGTGAAKAPEAATSPEPIDFALPTAAPQLIQRAECTTGTCTFSRWVPDEMQQSLSDRGEVVIWEELIGERAKVVFPSDKDMEIAGVVLEGSVGVLLREAKKPEPMKAEQWQGFRAPGGGVTLAALSGKPARIALLVAVAGEGMTLAKHLEQWNKDKRPFEWKERKRPFGLIDFAKVEDLAWGKGAYHARLGWDTSKASDEAASPGQAKAGEGEDKPAMVVNLIRFSKDAPVFEHVHDKERECLAIFEGDGELALKLLAGTGGSGDASASPNPMGVPVQPGTVVCIPSGMKHAWKPTGKAPLFALQVYAPPGPEQRFKLLAGKGKAPAKTEP